MSKGRRNKDNSCRQEKVKECEHLRGLNAYLITKMKEMKDCIVVSAKDNASMRDVHVMEKSRLEERIHERDDIISGMEDENAMLKRELCLIGRKYEEMEAKSIAAERSMLYKLCAVEKRCEESVMVRMNIISSFSQQKSCLEEGIKRILEEAEEERGCWKERMGELERNLFSVKQALETSLKEREEEKKSRTQLKINNQVLTRHILRERGRKEDASKDLDNARKAIEALFYKLKTSRDDLDAQSKEREALKQRIISLEGEILDAERINKCTIMKFENLKESGGWTGVLLKNQDDRINHLNESLQEERGTGCRMMTSVDNVMDELNAERREKDAILLNLKNVHQERKDLLQALMSTKEETVSKDLKVQEIEFLVEMSKRELESANSLLERANEMERLVSLESEIIRTRNTELEAKNESLKQQHHKLQRCMSQRILELKKAFIMIKCSNSQRERSKGVRSEVT